MKIVEVAEFYSLQGGGVKTYTHQKLEACASLGHSTTIIAPGKSNKEIIYPGGKIIFVKSPVLFLDPRYHFFSKNSNINVLIENENPDVLVGASPWNGGWIAGNWVSSKGGRKPLKILFMHTDPVAVYAYTFFEKFLSLKKIDYIFYFFWKYLVRLSNIYDATIVGSPWLAKRFSSYKLHNVHSIPFGVELSHFNSTRRDTFLRQSILQKCNLTSNDILALSVGRHHPEKRLKMIFRAIKKVQKSMNIGLYVVGDGPIRKWVEKWSYNNPNIYIAGQENNRDHLADIMASSDMLVHGSASETYGRVIAESLASGLPIIIPNKGAASSFYGHSYSEIYRAGDTDDAARAIISLSKRDLESSSKAAEKYAKETIGSDIDHFIRLYNFFKKNII
tara:strand:+ start:28 stop:1200 length:1173 start_codon:yes stop_codon:yes gene_type:complete